MSRKDNSSQSPTMPQTTGVAPKLCHIVKRPDFEGYGFNLHSEKIKPGQYIGKVDSGSPAEEAGLKEGDRIIEVNGVPIGSETHKQVVQRIKAIACEVRLLLLDVDGNDVQTTAAPSSAVPSTNGNNVNNETNESPAGGMVQEMPGASANISSISVVSTKRLSEKSNQSSHSSHSNGSNNNFNGSSMQQKAQGRVGVDVTDDAVKKADAPGTEIARSKTADDDSKVAKATTMSELISVPPPPSAAIATVTPQRNNSNALTSGRNNNSSNGASTSAASTMNPTSPLAVNKAGSLQLPMTAAEMRAKLLSKKKYDPKNESVDLKKKFEIIQKL